MRELNTYDTIAQNEALINELKGNLFEFLVGKELSQSKGLEAHYMKAIPPEFLERLHGYEHWLREHSEGLLVSLPALAKETASYLEKSLGAELDGVLVVGKLAGGSHDDRVKEADLLLKSGDQVHPISLKLCKENSFVNTKSAGVRSFFSRYFQNRFPDVRKHQDELNSFLDESYSSMCRTLHKMGGLKEQDLFDGKWVDAGFPELPGQLDKEMNQVLKSHYHEMICRVFELWANLLESNKKAFYECMMPLLGFGLKELGQLSCFYKGDYQLSYNSFKTSAPLLNSLNSSKLIPPKEGLSSFEMQMADCSFQVRLKPMNKFTVSGHKMNCSLKQLKS